MLNTLRRAGEPEGFILDPRLVLYLPLWKLDGASFAGHSAYLIIQCNEATRG